MHQQKNNKLLLEQLPEGAAIISSSTTTTHYLSDGSVRVDETIEYIDKTDGQRKTKTTSFTKQQEEGGEGTTTTSSSTTGDDTITTTVASEAVTVLHPLLLEATEEVKETKITDDDNVQEGNNILHVSLYSNHDFNAVIEYNKYSGDDSKERDSNRSGVNVLLQALQPTTTTSAKSSSSSSELPFLVCYQSDHLLTFVKAHIEPCATFARIYTKEAWNIRDECYKKSKYRKTCVQDAASLMFYSGVMLFTVALLAFRDDFCYDDYDCQEKKQIGLGISTMMITMVVIGRVCFYKRLAPRTLTYINKQLGIKEKCPTNTNDTANQYLFELAANSTSPPMMMPTTTISQQQVIMGAIV